MSELLSASVMRDIAALDESAMPSTCRVFTRTETKTATGGSKAGTDTERTTTPMRCRVTAPSGSRHLKVSGVTIASPGTVEVAIALSDYKAQSMVIKLEDVIDVTTVVRAPGVADLTTTVRYRVTGEPLFGSYSTNVTIPVSNV